MKVNLHPLLPELKNKVLEQARIEHIVSADCYQLAHEISTKTRKTISVTTVKRIYGFAQSRFAVSNFTLNVLSQYCDYESWQDFVHEMDVKTQKQSKYLTWNTIAHAAHLVTQFTLQTNKLTSGIPYPKTIQRASIHRHIDNFLKSAATGCIISAPYGMGKTIGITQWLDQQLTEQQAKKNNSIFLYVNSFSLTFAARYGFRLSHWFANLLNLSQHRQFDDFLTQYKDTPPGNFYLIIDDFNNNLINKRVFELLFRQLVDMSVHLADYSWIKIIVLMRPATWQKYGHLIENHPVINNIWFTDFPPFKRTSAINLFPFTTSELQELFTALGRNDVDQQHLLEKNGELISAPVLFQYYYQLKGNTPHLSTVERTDIFPVLSLYIRNHVLKGIQAAEKLFFLTQLAQLATFEHTSAYVNKKDILKLIKENSTLYTDLLHIGIIYEYQYDQSNRFIYQVRFQSAHIALYFLAQTLIEQHQGRKFNKILPYDLQDYKLSMASKHLLLSWISFFAQESADPQHFLAELDTHLVASQIVQ